MAIARDEALMTLHGSGPILDVARRVSDIIRGHRIEAAVIGGVAAVLHGHVRTTLDVDVYAANPQEFIDALEESGVRFHRGRREFMLDGVPIPAVTSKQMQCVPRRSMDIDDIRTVSLADLVDIKLRSGLKFIARAQDLADVIGLIRALRLTSAFASRLDASLRKEFRTLVRAVHKESKGS